MAMTVIIWSAVFLVALVAMVKGADWLLEAAETIGLALGMPAFIVGVVIVGAGTSFPELISSLVAAIQGAPEIVAANAIGSNIANILLIVGIAALVGRKLTISKSLIDLDLPLLALATVIFLTTAYDRSITFVESLLLLFTFIIYLSYTLVHKDDTAGTAEGHALLTARSTRRTAKVAKQQKGKRPPLHTKDFVMLGVGLISLALGAKYVVDSVIELSSIIGIATGIITMLAVAFGTSFPELLVSVRAALDGRSEVALGNVFGSNAFNLLVVVGIPGLFGTLPLDDPTYLIGLPTVALATLLFIISGISRRVHIWEGAMYLVFYGMFVGKLFRLF